METIGIPIAFTIISAILLWFIIGAKGNWLLKAVVIAATLCFSLAMWNSLEGIQGWPTKDELPAKFLLHWAVIEEGNKETGDPGTISLWVEDIGDQPQNDNWFSFLPKETTNGPRVYRIPYNRNTHEQLQKALEGIKKGKRFVGENKGKGIGDASEGEEGEGKDGQGKGKGKPGYEKDGQGKGQGDGEFDFSQQQDIIFHELPPALLPPKNEEGNNTQMNNPFAPDAAPSSPEPPIVPGN